MTAWLMVLSCTTLSGPLFAERASDAGASETAETSRRERARFHFEQGLRLMERERWDAALTELDESLRLHSNPTTHYNRALCLSSLGRVAEAHETLHHYLELVGDRLPAEERRSIEEELARLRALLVTVSIIVEQEGADVLIDGESVGRSPLEGPLLLLSGAHEIEVRLEGYRAQRREVQVVTGAPRRERFALEPLPRRARLRIEANVDGAAVLIDGELDGHVPYQGELGEGEHHLELQAEGYQSSELSLQLRAGEDRIVTLVLQPEVVDEPLPTRRRPLHRAWFWSTLGLGLASGVTATALGVAVHLADAEYDPRDSDAIEQWDRGQALMDGFGVMLALSCVSAAAALVLAFFTEFRRSVDGQGELSAFRLSPLLGRSVDRWSATAGNMGVLR